MPDDLLGIRSGSKVRGLNDFSLDSSIFFFLNYCKLVPAAYGCPIQKGGNILFALP